jgi:Flp pilus assembly protein TadB
MSEANQGYRKKQALLVLVIFACIGVAILGHSALVSVGAILAACGLAVWASTMEPAKKPDEHHH